MPCCFNIDFVFNAKKAINKKQKTVNIYEECIFHISAIMPWTGGMIAPPNIIIIKNEDPWDVYSFRPAMLNEKIHGHIIEQNNPPLKKA